MTNHSKIIKKSEMKKEFCELPGCEKEIPTWRHGNATTCCDEHGKQLKKQREAANYQKVRNTADPIIRLREHFNNLADEFGYEVPIDLNYVSPFKIDWSLKTGTFLKDGALGVALGDIGYIIYEPLSIKIFKL
jgi:hypothetical protein